jgi:thiol-disulfide isomerase/thioredoxin
MVKKPLFIGILGTFIAIGISACVRGPSEGVQVGSPAPDFQLPDLSGNKVSLGQFKGKVVILDFWATWCGPCRMSMPMLEKIQQQYGDRLALIAVNLEETPDVVRRYMQRQQMRSRVVLDEEGTTARAYRAESIPMQVLLDKDGVVRHIQIGFSPAVESRLKAQIDKLL